MFGRNVIGSTGRDVGVLADLEDVGWKSGGITIDWSLFTAVTQDTTLPDDTLVVNGQKYIRYGQVLCRVMSTEVQTITVANASGGTFTAAGSGAMAWNISAADMKTALELVFGAGKITSVTLNAGVYTVTFDDSLGNVATMAIVDSTTGSGHSVTVATVNQGAANLGKYGPYDPAATDGRQTLTRGNCYILNKTVLQFNPVSLNAHNSDNPAVFESGRAFKARLLMTSGAHSLAAGPTVTEFETVFPGIQYVQI